MLSSQWVVGPLVPIVLKPRLVWVQNTAISDSPKRSRALVGDVVTALKGFDQLDASLGYAHFFWKACDPNQKLMMAARIAISSSLNTISIAWANATPVLYAYQIPATSTTISRPTNK